MNGTFDPQQPSTSTSSSQQPLHNTPATSPEWTHSAALQNAQMGGNPAAAAGGLNWQMQQMQQFSASSQSILSVGSNTGASTMRRQLAEMRLANTKEWLGESGPSTAAAAAEPSVRNGLSRASSVISLMSNCSRLSGVSGMSRLSGLSVRTNYDPAQLQRLEMDRFQSNQPTKVDEETPQEQQVRAVVQQYSPERLFEWIAVEGNKTHPQYREYRKMLLRICSKRDLTLPGAPKKLKFLADRLPSQIGKILEDLVSEVHACTGQERTDALNSLKDCASAAPAALVKLFLNPPRQSTHHKISIEVLLDCIDPRDSDDAVTAARILLLLLQPPVSSHDCKHIRKKGMTIEGTKRLLSVILYHKDVLPAKRRIFVEALKKYGAKSEFLKAGGIQALLLYLDKSADANEAPPATNTLALVDRDAELIYMIINYLKVLVSITPDGKIPRTRARAIEELTKHNGVQILSIWLLEFGLQDTLVEVSSIFANVSSDGTRLQNARLEDPIQRSIQLLGSDDPNITFNLIAFLRNVCSISTSHKSTAIGMSICAELLDVINKWATASTRLEATKSRYYVNIISIAAETLKALTEPDQHHVHVKALDSLLNAKDTVVQFLMRVASFDFAYSAERSITDIPQRAIACEMAFAALPPAEQVVEQKTKAYALAVLLRMCERCAAAPNAPSLGLAKVQEPLLGELLSVMMWRRLWDTYRQVQRIEKQRPRATWAEELEPVKATLLAFTGLAPAIYREPDCLKQVLGLVGVAVDSVDGTKPSFNPFQMLDTVYPEMAAAVMTNVDALIHYFKAHKVRTHKHPMLVWLQPGGRDGTGDYKHIFSQVLIQLHQGKLLTLDIAQRLHNSFNECISVYSPALTPAYPPMTTHPGYRH